MPPQPISRRRKDQWRHIPGRNEALLPRLQFTKNLDRPADSALLGCHETGRKLQAGPGHGARFENRPRFGSRGVGSAPDRLREPRAGDRIALQVAAALEARLIACANLVPGIESHYWWQGEMERGREVLLILKTTAARLEKLEKLLVARHPYDTPEFVALTFSEGNRRYLNWLTASCEDLPLKPAKRPPKRPPRS
jgi:periplasmic divalent cation tolerance protein